jgi:hypothetical protein
MGAIPSKQKLPGFCIEDKTIIVHLKNGGNVMPIVTSNKKKQNGITVEKKMKDYSNAPALKKKAAKAEEFLQRHGLPEDFVKKNK